MEDETDEVKKTGFKKTADVQRVRLERLMKKHEEGKEIFVPDKRNYKLPGVFNPPEFIRNIWGSSAGAGSGDFHVYRGIRRREYARQKFEKIRDKIDAADEKYKDRVATNQKKSDEKTAKKRKKRQKQKEKRKTNKKVKQNNVDKQKEESSDEESDDEEKQEGDNPAEQNGDVHKDEDKVDTTENTEQDTGDMNGDEEADQPQNKTKYRKRQEEKESSDEEET